jgi:histidinol dehydrogenase
MEIIKYPPITEWPALVKRPVLDTSKLFALVEDIFADVRLRGDAAIIKYNALYDGCTVANVRVSTSEILAARAQLSDDLKFAIHTAKSNIEKFHQQQREIVKKIETIKGVTCWRESRPIERVGIYIPGGSAPLFSTVLMLGVPAVLAGCEEIILCTPPDATGKIPAVILYTAQLLGINSVFRVGGIQAIGAMTFGTESIPAVYKIFGPGNQYVTAAKTVSQQYGIPIDMPAGPSEVLVIADQTARPEFVAADLLAQAEHGTDSQVMLVTNTASIVDQVLVAVEEQLRTIPRASVIRESFQHSKAIVLDDLRACIDFSNLYAPEHLILAVDLPNKLVPSISNAGSVFIGHYSCESAGDYASGTNHALPTNGHARSYSGVSLDSFLKKITFQAISEEGICQLGPVIELMAQAENLFAHKNAVTVRMISLSK